MELSQISRIAMSICHVTIAVTIISALSIPGINSAPYKSKDDKPKDEYHLDNSIISSRQGKESLERSVKNSLFIVQPMANKISNEILVADMTKRDTSCSSQNVDQLMQDFMGQNMNEDIHDDKHKYENEDCPTNNGPLSTDSAMTERALCPWIYEENIDVNRIPISIQYARCKCRNCMVANEDLHNESQCQPIYKKTRVFRRTECDSEGVSCRYEAYVEDVPVACSCIRMRTYSGEENSN